MENEMKNLFLKYNLACDELKRIFELIYKEYEINVGVNPIEHIKFRIKKKTSIKEKLQKYNLEYTSFNIENRLSDVVGCRIVCSFLSDIETLKDVIKKLDNNNILKIVEERDYINNPNILIAGSKELDIKTLEFEIEIRKSDILNMVKNILKEDKSQIKSLGFTYIQYIFYYSETILNFFAQHFISQIFLEYDIEKYLHENYINFEEFLNKNNKKSLIMKFIFQKDEDLTNYVINHPILLNEITYAFDYIQKAWDYYVNRETNNIYESIYNKIFEYIKSKSRDNDVQKLWDMAYYAAYTSGILEPFFQFSVGIDEEYLKIKKSNCEQYTKNSDVNKTIDYLYFKKIIEEYLNQIPDVGYKTKRKIISK